ncbi:MAG: hypothetical protein JXA37_13085 [Chloroflexia bacterium]|nr:hypothetical protein [Chloroflexia bacterium]
MYSWEKEADCSFPRLDDLLDQFRQLAGDHPAEADWCSYGRSRRGGVLWALRAGWGPLRVLAYGFPQPDEPLGGLALLELARELLGREEWLGQASWTLCPCVDPDGARLNEAWFSRGLDLRAYARHYYRPPEGEQVEWSFPSSDPDWPWERPLPETRALQALLDAVQPQILFPLHNALLGGGYAFISGELGGLAGRLPALWQSRGLFTHRGEPELPFAPELAPGVYRLPELGEIAAALRANGIEDPAGLLDCGAPAYGYVRRYGRVWTVVPELPLFLIEGIADGRPAELSRRELLTETLERERGLLAAWSALAREGLPLLGRRNPYRLAVLAHQRTAPVLLQGTARWLESDGGLARPATVAELLDSRYVGGYLALLPWGLLAQALRWEPAADLCGGVLDQVERTLERGVERALAGLSLRPLQPSLLCAVVIDMIGVVLDAAWADLTS